MVSLKCAGYKNADSTDQRNDDHDEVVGRDQVSTRPGTDAFGRDIDQGKRPRTEELAHTKREESRNRDRDRDRDRDRERGREMERGRDSREVDRESDGRKRGRWESDHVDRGSRGDWGGRGGREYFRGRGGHSGSNRSRPPDRWGPPRRR